MSESEEFVVRVGGPLEAEDVNLAFDSLDGGLEEIVGFALTAAVNPDSPEADALDAEFGNRLWNVLLKASIAQALITGETQREVLTRAWKLARDDESFRRGISEAIDRLRAEQGGGD